MIKTKFSNAYKIMLKWLKDKKVAVNYYYFGFIFIYLIILSIIHIVPFTGSLRINIIFIIQAVLQACAEILFLLTLFIWIKNKYLKTLYLGFLFFLLFIHFLNHFLVHLMDTNLPFIFKMFFAEGFDNFFAMIKAININLAITFLVLAVLVSMPILGSLLYNFTHHLSQKKPLKFSLWHIVNTFFILLFTFISLDLCILPFLNPKTHNSYAKRLPFGLTFFSPDSHFMTLPSYIKKERDENTSFALLAQKNLKLQKHPNIYIFIIETFREDFVNESIAPNIYKFKKNNISFTNAFSSANASQISWYSIFHANFPYYWRAHKGEHGSLPLNILKNLGYKINVYCSADLSYFQMEKSLFGTNHHIVDNFYDFSKMGEPHKRDRLTMMKLIEDSGKNTPSISIIFLDSTHSEYSWPQGESCKFMPFSNHINYVKLCYVQKELELVKNSYRNAIYYLDSLLGKFFKNLPTADDVIVITGDHGEEFFEQGAMFHASHINSLQTRVPLYYKLPNAKKPTTNLTCHMDIFPSILHYLTNNEDFKDLFDGESIFKKERWPYVVCLKQHSGPMPQDFFIHSGNYKLMGYLDHGLKTKKINIVSVDDANDHPIHLKEKEILEKQFQNAFSHLIE